MSSTEIQDGAKTGGGKGKRNLEWGTKKFKMVQKQGEKKERGIWNEEQINSRRSKKGGDKVGSMYNKEQRISEYRKNRGRQGKEGLLEAVVGEWCVRPFHGKL